MSEQSEPSTIVNPPKQPLWSWRRARILAVVAVAFAIAAITLNQGRTAGGPGDDAAGLAGCRQDGVVAFTPCPGGRVLRQSAVGVELETGYDGRIAVNGIDVPEEQMLGAIVPGSEAYAQLTAEQRALGPRPNTKHVVKFAPGSGQVIEQFSGEVQITITYWPLAQGQDNARSFSYSVFVT